MIDRELRETIAWSMLTTRAQSYEWLPSAHGGMSQAQVAGALHGLAADPYLAGLLCEAGHIEIWPRVFRRLYREADKFATREEWNLPRGPRQVKLVVLLALVEAIYPSVICPQCRGEGVSPNPWKVDDRRACNLCDGRGRVPKTERSRADIIEVDKSNWHRIWRPRYGAVWQVLQDWRQEAKDHVAARLRDAAQRRA